MGSHVCFLVNFVSPNLVAVLGEVARRVERLSVLSSVEMESNRDWQANWGDLNVVVQKSWTLTRHPKHPGGYREPNYIHIPIDTLRQLRRLRPDVVVSHELGARTAISSIYRMMNPSCVHLASVYASERSEQGRGLIRKSLRRRLLSRVDWVTYNGESCKRLLLSLGANESNMSPWNYAADPLKPYRGELVHHLDRHRLKILTVGQLAERKGIVPAVEQLAKWAHANPEVQIQWNVLGSGPLESDVRAIPVPENVELILHGHCDPEAIRDQYRDNDVLLFPTLADEWGLVVDEALFSGLPVIGSCHSQAVTTLIRDGDNGLVYDPTDSSSLAVALDWWTRHGVANDELRQAARKSVASRTPSTAAQQLIGAIGAACAFRGKPFRSIASNTGTTDPSLASEEVLR